MRDRPTTEARRSDARQTDARLTAAIRALLPRRHAPPPPAGDTATRLDHLERDVQEVRTRVNALFFSVIGIAIAELASRVVAG